MGTRSVYNWAGDPTSSEADFLRTPGPGKIQLSDGRWVTESSSLGQAFIAKQEGEKQRAQFQTNLSSLMERADPFASQRSQYATKLSDLMGMGGSGSPAPTAAAPVASGVTALSGRIQPGAAPSAATSAPTGASGTSRLNEVLQSNPFFQANMDAGQEAAKRRLAQMGMGTSGNAALELQKNAQANMSGEYFRMADLLGRFSGANESPSAGTNAGLNLMNIGEQARQFDFKNSPKASWQTPSPSYSIGSYWGK